MLGLISLPSFPGSLLGTPPDQHTMDTSDRLLQENLATAGTLRYRHYYWIFKGYTTYYYEQNSFIIPVITHNKYNNEL